MDDQPALSEDRQVSIIVPKKIAAICQNKPERLIWLNRLPNVVLELQRRWSLKLGNPFDGDEVSCAWVAPVLFEAQKPAVLKLGMPHMEGEQEIEGLRFWDGDPTVRLLKADDDLCAMLLERCQPGTCLRDLPEAEQDNVIASLLRRLWRRPSPSHQFRPLTIMTRSWISETLVQSRRWLDPALVSEGLGLFRTLPEMHLEKYS